MFPFLALILLITPYIHASTFYTTDLRQQRLASDAKLDLDRILAITHNTPTLITYNDPKYGRQALIGMLTFLRFVKPYPFHAALTEYKDRWMSPNGHPIQLAFFEWHLAHASQATETHPWPWTRRRAAVAAWLGVLNDWHAHHFAIPEHASVAVDRDALPWMVRFLVEDPSWWIVWGDERVGLGGVKKELLQAMELNDGKRMMALLNKVAKKLRGQMLENTVELEDVYMTRDASVAASSPIPIAANDVAERVWHTPLQAADARLKHAIPPSYKQSKSAPISQLSPAFVNKKQKIRNHNDDSMLGATEMVDFAWLKTHQKSVNDRIQHVPAGPAPSSAPQRSTTPSAGMMM